ncbi:MAG TPA: nickel pincer cofactor biosynthesis protein LarB [Gemmatimonadaceae bacterium]|nr:nickel pincer cofactor biosynthesis protein LarB [Gemmatimonadaceae bacterium]
MLALLQRIATGTLDPAAALDMLALEPVEALPFASIDHHRALRQGFPEVILAQGKTEAQVLAIAERIAEHGDGFLATRADDGVRRALEARFPSAVVNDVGRTVHLPATVASTRPAAGTLLIVTAGTGDLPVAEEAASTACALGLSVARLNDVGVAGLHRILGQGSQLLDARAVIVVAGMDGALPSVVGGLVRRPVIAVPTSVGYGASFGGVAALLSMLNSCAAGVTVVNIDNGFGAAMAAARILAD